MKKSTQVFITLLRHGLSTANQLGIVQGQLDYPLHQEGIDQARRLGEFWHAQGRLYEKIVSSPLQRAVETARLISSALSIPILQEPLWKERGFGEAEGLPYELFREKSDTHPAQVSHTDPVFPGGESEWDLLNRAARATQKIFQNGWKSCLVVSHGGILNAALRSILGIRLIPGEPRQYGFSFDNTGFTDITFDQNTSRWQILGHNARPHLEQGK